MKLKKVCAVSLAGLMLLALTGCGGSGDKKAAAPKDGGKKLVMYWGALDDWLLRTSLNSRRKPVSRWRPCA